MATLVEDVNGMSIENKKPDEKTTPNKKSKKQVQNGTPGHPMYLDPQPSYIAERIALFDQLKAKYDTEVEAKENHAIKVTLPDGNIVDGLSWKTTPYEIAQGISQGLADNAVVSKVNGEVWDLDRVLEGDCTVEVLKFDDKEAQAVFWLIMPLCQR